MENRFSGNLPNKPSYVDFDRMEMDSFLYTVGNFDSREREIFYSLCQSWRGLIDYGESVEKLGVNYSEMALTKLMSALSRARCGLIVRSAERYEPQKIILTEPNSIHYWYWKIENMWLGLQHSIGSKIPTLHKLVKLEDFPSGLVSSVPLENLSRRHIDKNFSGAKIFSLDKIGDVNLVFTASTFPCVINHMKDGLKMQIDTPGIRQHISNCIAIEPGALPKALSDGENLIWRKFSSLIISEWHEISVFQSVLSTGILLAAEFIKTLAENEIEIESEESSVPNEQKNICRNIYNKMEDKLITPVREFRQEFKPYLDRWPHIQIIFRREYMDRAEGEELPDLIKVNDCIISRSNLYPVFKSELEKASSELSKIYVNLANRSIMGFSRRFAAVFNDPVSFRVDIMRRISANFSFLRQLLVKPSLVSRSLLYYVDNVEGVREKDILKSRLSQYFDPKTVKFIELEELLGLRPFVIFQKGFNNSVFPMRLLMQFLGWYKICLNHFQELEIKCKTGEKFAPLAKTAERGRGKPSRQPDINSEKSCSGVSEARKGGLYSLRSRNKAWADFSEAYQTFKSKAGR